MKKAQIWVETVIYTLIGLAIIAIVLAIATPAIDKYKDRIVVEQTITIMNDMNNLILDVKESGPGNKKIINELRIKKGTLFIDGESDKMTYVLSNTRLEYSEAGTEAKQGDITILTGKNGRRYNITLAIEYGNVDITYNGINEKKAFNPVAVPYKISVENNGTIVGATEEKIQLDVKEIS